MERGPLARCFSPRESIGIPNFRRRYPLFEPTAANLERETPTAHYVVMSSLSSSLRLSGRRSIILGSRRSQTLVIPVAGRAPHTAPAGISTCCSARRLLAGNNSSAVRAASSSSPHSFRRRQTYGEAPQKQHTLWATRSTFAGTNRGMMSKARRQGEGGDEGASSSKDGQQRGEEQYDDADYEPEPEEKVSIVKTVAGVCLLGLVLAALGATVTELWPSHMAPQSIMSHAHDAFQADPDVSDNPGIAHNCCPKVDLAAECTIMPADAPSLRYS